MNSQARPVPTEDPLLPPHLTTTVAPRPRAWTCLPGLGGPGAGSPAGRPWPLARATLAVLATFLVSTAENYL